MGQAFSSFDKLASNIFGPQIKLFHLMEEELGLSCESFCCFLAACCTPLHGVWSSLLHVGSRSKFVCQRSCVSAHVNPQPHCARDRKNTVTLSSSEEWGAHNSHRGHDRGVVTQVLVRQTALANGSCGQGDAKRGRGASWDQSRAQSSSTESPVAWRVKPSMDSPAAPSHRSPSMQSGCNSSSQRSMEAGGR